MKPLDKKTGIIIILSSTLAVAVIVAALDRFWIHAPVHAVAVPQPVFEWIPKKESFVLDAGEGHIVGPIAGSGDSEISSHFVRFDFVSTGPVDAGAMDSNWFQSANDKSGWRFFNAQGALCFTPKTLSAEQTCRLTGSSRNGYVLIRDSRTPGDAGAKIIAGVEAKLGVKEPLERQESQTRVDLTLYLWQCLRNCNQ